MKKGEYTVPRVKLNSVAHRNLAKSLKEKQRGRIDELGDFRLRDIKTPDGKMAKIVDFEATKEFKELLK